GERGDGRRQVDELGDRVGGRLREVHVAAVDGGDVVGAGRQRADVQAGRPAGHQGRAQEVPGPAVIVVVRVVVEGDDAGRAGGRARRVERRRQVDGLARGRAGV